MKVFKLGAVAMLAAALCVGETVQAQVTIQVIPSSAPNAFGSPSYSGWRDNAIYALVHGLAAYGDPSQPTYYTQAPTTMSVLDNIVTGFPSWQGQANPGTAFGPAYSGELGNRLQDGLKINGHGSLISIDQVSYVATSTDPGNSLGFSFGIGSYNYSSDYVGIIWGPGGEADIAGYTYVTSGPANQLVNEIVGRGSGNAWDTYETDPGPTDQDRIDNLALSLGNAQFDFTGTYTYGDVQGSASVTFLPVPEPSTFALAGLGLAAVVIRRRRRV